MDINLVEKTIRSEVIRDHMRALGIKRAVCFTCGNAAQALRDAGIDTLAIGRGEALEPGQWFTQQEIVKQWPGHFNATSGDIPVFLIVEIARRMRERVPVGSVPLTVKLGSGETALVIALAYPEIARLVTLYRDGTPETEYHAGATLNGIIAAIYGAEVHAKTGS